MSRWFLERNGASNKTDQQKNRTKIEVDWNFNDGVEALINQVNTGLRYAAFTRYPISDPDAVNIAMHIVLKAGLFREAYHNNAP